MTIRLGGVLLVGTLVFAEAQTLAQSPPATQPVPARQPASADLSGLEDIDLLDLEVPVVVTAGRRRQEIHTVTYAASVITAEDIRRAGAHTVADALRLVPGVDVAALSATVPAVSARGFHGFYNSRTLVLVDGRQLYDSLFGGTSWHAWPFQIADIARIEVIRGPGGVGWGGNTLNGVINIVTKDPAEQTGLTFEALGGSRGTHKTHLGYGIQEGKLRLRVSGEYAANDGFVDGGSPLYPLKDSYRVGNVGVHGVYAASADDTFTFSGGSGLVGEWAPPGVVNYVGVQRSDAQANYLMGKWEHRRGAGDYVELIGFVNDYHGHGASPWLDFRFQQLALQLSHTLEPAKNHTLTWGVDTRADLLDAGGADPYLMSKSFVGTGLIGLYVQDTWRFAPKWALDLGARLDYEFYSGFQPSGRAALSYELSKNSLVWIAASRAFQMPPAAARFLSVPAVTPLVRLKANQDMASTNMLAYELGYRGRFFDRLETNVNLYWHQYGNLGQFSPGLGPPGLICVVSDNDVPATTYGLEFDARYRATDRLTLLGHYTLELLDWRSSWDYTMGSDLIWPPKHKFMLGSNYALTDDLSLSAYLHYVDAVTAANSTFPLAARHLSPYFRLDLRGEYEFWDDRAAIAVGVHNLLDNGHAEAGSMFLNSAEVPRIIYAEFRLRVK
ncbi:MAG: TonB-dependent receptor [Phycisphaerae bacterium]